MIDIDLAAPHVADVMAATFVQQNYLLVRDFIDNDLLTRLTALSSNATWQPLNPIDGEVAQTKEESWLGDAAELPAVADISARLRCIAGLLDCDWWIPNEFVLSRYLGPDAGISSHRDSARYLGLVALITVSGSARFSIAESRDGPSVQSWMTRAGDLVVLRGAEPGHIDRRPFHAVAGPRIGQRVSLSARWTKLLPSRASRLSDGNSRIPDSARPPQLA